MKGGVTSRTAVDGCSIDRLYTRISIKVPASRSYTRIPLVKSVGLRTCAHASARVLTHTSPPTNSFRIFLDTQYDMRLGWKMRKRMIFRLCAMFDTEMRLRKLCDKHIHYEQCLRFLSNKYNVLAVIFVMCINDRCHHSQYSLQLAKKFFHDLTQSFLNSLFAENSSRFFIENIFACASTVISRIWWTS